MAANDRPWDRRVAIAWCRLVGGDLIGLTNDMSHCDSVASKPMSRPRWRQSEAVFRAWPGWPGDGIDVDLTRCGGSVDREYRSACIDVWNPRVDAPNACQMKRRAG